MLGLLSESVESSRTTMLDTVNFQFFNPPVLLRTAERVRSDITIYGYKLIATQTRDDYLRGQNTFAPVETQLQHSPTTLQYFGQTPRTVIAPAPGAVGPDMLAPVNGTSPVSGMSPVNSTSPVNSMSPVMPDFNGHMMQPGYVPHVTSSPHMSPVNEPFAPVPQIASSPMIMQQPPRAASPHGDQGHVIQPIIVPNNSGEIPRTASGNLVTYTDQHGVQQQIEVPQLVGTPPHQPYVVLIPSPRQERRARTPDKHKDTQKSSRTEQLNKEHGHHRRTSSFDQHVTVRRDRKTGSSAEPPRSNMASSSDASNNI